MIQTTKYFDMASLSEAAYVDFSDIDFSRETATAEVEEYLKTKNKGGNFSSTQAQAFVDKWEVVSHQANTDSGFSATLFKLRNPESGETEYYEVNA